MKPEGGLRAGIPPSARRQPKLSPLKILFLALGIFFTVLGLAGQGDRAFMMDMYVYAALAFLAFWWIVLHSW